MSGRNGRMAIFSCVYLLNAELVFFCFLVVLPGGLFVVYIVFYSLLIYLVLNLQQRIAKKKKSAACYFISYFGMN